MRIGQKNIHDVCEESRIWESKLQLDHANILELGCGTADLTRKIAMAGTGRCITALEVDEIQHAKNMQVDDLPNVRFVAGGAEDIPAADHSYDIVFMFKSLHHVPINCMDKALDEIRRVLKPGGRAYISEPIFAGDFNDILSLFHDEEQVRKAAFAAVKKAVDDERFALIDEVFFLTPMHFSDFSEFKQKVIGVTHSHHQLSDAIYRQVKQAFSAKMTDDGAYFHMQVRVDLLEAL